MPGLRACGYPLSYSLSDLSKILFRRWVSGTKVDRCVECVFFTVFARLICVTSRWLRRERFLGGEDILGEVCPRIG